MRFLLAFILTIGFSLNVLSGQQDSLVISKVDSIDGVYIPYSLEDCFVVLNKLLPDSTRNDFLVLNEDEVIGQSHFGLGLWIRNNWGLWAGSRLASFFNEKSITHPDDMSSLILTSYHRYLNEKEIDFEGLIRSYQEYWLEIEKQEKEIEQLLQEQISANLEWLEANQIPLNSLPKANPSELIYTCDSVLLLKQTTDSQDTVTIWTVGMENYMDTTRLKKWLVREKFGKTMYVSGVNSQGNLTLVSLSPKTFHMRNDSLFELETFYKITQDSLFELYNKMTEVISDTVEMSKIRELINRNRYESFKLIFHPNLFNESNLYNQNVNGDSVELVNTWTINGKSYYKITVSNFTGKYDSEYSYLFDEEYKLLEYDGCNEREISKLIEKNEEKK